MHSDESGSSSPVFTDPVMFSPRPQNRNRRSKCGQGWGGGVVYGGLVEEGGSYIFNVIHPVKAVGVFVEFGVFRVSGQFKKTFQIISVFIQCLLSLNI